MAKPKQTEPAAEQAPARKKLPYLERTLASIRVHAARRNLKAEDVEKEVLKGVHALSHKWPNLKAKSLVELEEPQLRAANQILPAVLTKLCGGHKRRPEEEPEAEEAQEEAEGE